MPLDKIAFFGAGWQIHAESLAAYLAAVNPTTSRHAGKNSSLPIRTWRQTSAEPPTVSVETGTARNRGTMIREE